MSSAAEPPLKDVLGKVAAAYGANQPAAIVEKGTTTSFRRGGGTLLRMAKAPDRFSIKIDYATGTEIRSMIGSNAWQQGTPANPILRAAIALQAARIALPWNLLAKSSAAIDRGSVTGPDGKLVRAIELPLEDRLKLVVEIDIQTGHMLRSRGIQRVGDSEMEFATVYGDFRDANGRTHAAREEHYAMGQHTGHSVIDKVEYPQTLPDSAFAP
jgi:hypothetical protein